MDRFDAMQAFVRVVESGSFTRAADSLGLGRSTVTQLVQQLEARLGTTLLQRSTRRVQPTADGLAFHARAVQLLADLDEVESSLRDGATTPRGRLRVDVPAPLARMLLVPAFPDFHARYPGIQLDLGVSDRQVDLVAEHVDCVLRGGEPRDPSLVARRVGLLPLGVYAAPAYLARHGRPQHPADLEQPGHLVVGALWGGARGGLPYPLQRGEERVRVRGRHAIAVDEGNAYLEAALAGLGVACMPAYMADPHVARGELVALFEDWHVTPMPLYLAWVPRRHVSARLRVFADWVAGLLARHAPVPGLGD